MRLQTHQSQPVVQTRSTASSSPVMGGRFIETQSANVKSSVRSGTAGTHAAPPGLDGSLELISINMPLRTELAPCVISNSISIERWHDEIEAPLGAPC